MAYPYSQNMYPMVQYQTFSQQPMFYPPAVVSPQTTQMVAQQTPQQATAQATVAAPATNITWIENEKAADNYPVAIGNTVMLITYDERTAFKKSTDMTGKPLPMEVFDMIPRNKPQETEGIQTESFVTKEEFISRMDSIEKKLAEIAENEAEEMVVVPVKKRGRKPHVVVETDAEVITNEPASNI